MRKTGNINRELEILRKNETEMQEIKNTATKMKNAFGGFISRLDTVEERIPEPEDISVVTSKTEKSNKNCQFRIKHLGSISFKNEGKINNLFRKTENGRINYQQ